MRFLLHVVEVPFEVLRGFFFEDAGQAPVAGEHCATLVADGHIEIALEVAVLEEERLGFGQQRFVVPPQAWADGDVGVEDIGPRHQRVDGKQAAE